MKKIGLFAISCFLLISCKDKNIPDVSGIKAELTIERFEKDFFALDTTQLKQGLDQLKAKYPGFTGDFLANILGLPPASDSSTEVYDAIKRFLRDYRPLKDSADKIFGTTDNIEKELKQGLQFVKYYFPAYKAPAKLITYIGPMDAYYEASLGGYSDVITSTGMATGLQLHMGSNFSMYQSTMGQAFYPDYISRRFTPSSIVVNNMKNIIDDIYPEKLSGKPLVDQMIEKGKRLYILDKLLPATPDTLKIGYTASQLKGCIENEGRIWNFFVINNMLLNNDPSLLKNYMADGPKTVELGDGSPGYIGLFTGWQIVKKYMKEHEELKLPELLQLDAHKIFEQAKYRPK
jgi:hypothetical protein